MELYPIKPGTSIQLPQRAVTPKKAASRKKKLSPEEQVIRQRKTIRWLTAVLICTFLMLGLSVALLFDIMPEEEAKVTIQYRVVETAAAYNGDSAMPATEDEKTKAVTITDNKGTAEPIVNLLKDYAVEKKWSNYEPDQDTIVKLTLHRKIVDGGVDYVDGTFAQQITLPTDADPAPAEGERNPWKKTWTDLPVAGTVTETAQEGDSSNATPENPAPQTDSATQTDSDPSDPTEQTTPAETTHSGNWVYYVTEDDVMLNDESILEQFVVSIVDNDGKQSTVTNTFGMQDFSFKKKWTNGVDQEGIEWPTYEDEEGNTKHLPISVTLYGELKADGTVVTLLTNTTNAEANTFEFSPDENPKIVTIYRKDKKAGTEEFEEFAENVKVVYDQQTQQFTFMQRQIDIHQDLIAEKVLFDVFHLQ